MEPDEDEQGIDCNCEEEIGEFPEPDDYVDDYSVDGVTEFDPWYDEWDEEVDWGDDE